MANDAFKEQGGNELFWLFFERKGVGIFLKYCVCNVAVDFPKNFEDLKSVHTVPDSVIEKVWKRIYVGEGGIWAKDFLLTHVESVYKNHRGNPFKLRDCTEKWIRENESAVRNKWLPGCYEILLNRQIASLFAEKFFSDDYIESVRGILLRGCFPSCINETKFRGRLDRGETPVQTTILVKYVQFLRDYQDAKNSDAPEAKEKFLKGAKFLKAFCIGDRNAEEAEKKGYRFVNPNLRKRILNGVQEMQKEFEE